MDDQTTLLGFVGTPWTLAAYAIEGKADRDCKQTKVRFTRSQISLWQLQAIHCWMLGCVVSLLEKVAMEQVTMRSFIVKPPTPVGLLQPMCIV